MTDVLTRIQKLQFSNREDAAALALSFLRDSFPGSLLVNAVHVELRPLAVSLNSFNGFVTLSDGVRLFFKTHTEPDGIIGEYYNASTLAYAGYPVIQPIFSSTEAGKQILVYEVITAPSVFDLAWQIETGVSDQFSALALAQNAADDLLRVLYAKTLEFQRGNEAAKAPVHQLFYHRLMGGRLERFYGPLPGNIGSDVTIGFPGISCSMRDVRRAKWVINGQEYQDSLDDLITRAIEMLNPSQPGQSIIGHGDAHNGNVFFMRFEQNTLLYFDPAFAGRHSPILDLTKPLFHNVFAMWMYFPYEKRQLTQISWNRDKSHIYVEHDYHLHPVRMMFLESKLDRVLLPVLRNLKESGILPSAWRSTLKVALFCCPFLTMNLADDAKFPPEISLLGLSMAIEMGAESENVRSLIDSKLDGIEAQLNETQRE